jgi:mono/diheme cytochrome c family protein
MLTKSKVGKVVFIFTILLAAFSLMSFVAVLEGWPVPAQDAAKTNLIKSDATSMSAGETTYTTSCKMCHGIDGKKLANADLTSTDFQAQTDGAIFYKITTGKGSMPSYKTKLADDEDRWNLVNYVRSLK